MKVSVIYWSGTGNTEAMANLIIKGIEEAGSTASLINISDAKLDDVEGYDAVAFGSPSMGDEVVEEYEMQPFIESAKDHLKGKKVALFGSYGWGDGQWMRSWCEEMKNIGALLISEEGLIVNNSPEGSAADDCIAFGKKIVNY